MKSLLIHGNTSMLMSCYGYCMEMTLLFMFMKYNRYTSRFIGLAYINEIRTCGLPNTYYMTFIPFAKLIASYEIGTMILLIAQDFVSKHCLFRYGFRFFAFLLTLQFCVSLQLIAL